MTVKTDVWHYNLYKASFTDHPRNAMKPTNLCRYFWRCVATTTVLGGILGLCALIVWAVIAIPMVVGGVIAILVACVAAMFGLAAGLDAWESHKRIHPEPGIVGAYLKARKEKICPIIEIVKV